MHVCLEKNSLFRCARHRATICGKSSSHCNVAQLEWVELLRRQATQAPDLRSPFQAAHLSYALCLHVSILAWGYHLYPRLPSFLPPLTFFWTTHGVEYVVKAFNHARVGNQAVVPRQLGRKVEGLVHLSTETRGMLRLAFGPRSNFLGNWFCRPSVRHLGYEGE